MSEGRDTTSTSLPATPAATAAVNNKNKINPLLPCPKLLDRLKASPLNISSDGTELISNFKSVKKNNEQKPNNMSKVNNTKLPAVKQQVITDSSKMKDDLDIVAPEKGKLPVTIEENTDVIMLGASSQVYSSPPPNLVKNVVAAKKTAERLFDDDQSPPNLRTTFNSLSYVEKLQVMIMQVQDEVNDMES